MSFTMFFLKKNEQEEKEENTPQCIQEQLNMRKVIHEMSRYLQKRKWDVSFKVRIKWTDAPLGLLRQLHDLYYFHLFLIIQNLGAGFRGPKSGYRSQKQSALPPANVIHKKREYCHPHS